MSHPGPSGYRIFLHAALTAALLSGCQNSRSEKAPANQPPPRQDGMCTLQELGEASDLVEAGRIPDNQYGRISGMSDPKTLVWQDARTKKVFFAAKVLGAEGRLFYMEELQTGSLPGLRESFTGTILKWPHLHPELAAALEGQFRSQWNVEIDKAQTYIIRGGEKPGGCP